MEFSWGRGGEGRGMAVRTAVRGERQRPQFIGICMSEPAMQKKKGNHSAKSSSIILLESTRGQTA